MKKIETLFLFVLPVIFAFGFSHIFFELLEVWMVKANITWFRLDLVSSNQVAESVIKIITVLGLTKIFRKQMKKVFLENICAFYIDRCVRQTQ